jgi:hypothetical protein
MDTVKPTARLCWGAWFIAGLVALLILWPLPLVEKFYAIGFGICPQRPAHSYFLGGALLPGEAFLRAAVPLLDQLAPAIPTKLPVEARMYGMFAGFLLTWVYSFWRGRGRAALMPSPLFLAIFVGFIAVMGVDGVNATLFDLHNTGLPIAYAYTPRLDIRFLTGWLCGIAMAGLVLPVVNYCLWRDAELRPLFQRFRELLPLLGLGAVIWLLLTSGSALFFYPVAIMAPAGILTTIGALNVVLVLTLGKGERVAVNWLEALNPFAVALVMTLCELGVLSLLRWLAFGFAEIR